MRRGWIPLMIAVAAAGCGGKSSSSQTSSTSGTSSAAPAAPASYPECNKAGINPAQMREGTCTHGGITYVIVNRNSTLQLQTLAAKLNKVAAAQAPGAPGGESVIASVTITNKLSSPQRFDRAGAQQTGLILDGRVYKQDAGAEAATAKSCSSQNRPPLRPGASQTCDLIFHVPASSLSDLGKHGSGDLYVVNLGDTITRGSGPVGSIRLYH